VALEVLGDVERVCWLLASEDGSSFIFSNGSSREVGDAEFGTTIATPSFQNSVWCLSQGAPCAAGCVHERRGKDVSHQFQFLTSLKVKLSQFEGYTVKTYREIDSISRKIRQTRALIAINCHFYQVNFVKIEDLPFGQLILFV
jgi:hypothetical protein